MEDYLKKHATQAAYTTWAASNDFVTPNVSLIDADGSLEYNAISIINPIPTTYVVTATFDISYADSSVQILGEDYNIQTSNISKIEIDNVELPSVVSTYNFSTSGEHTVSYTLSDSTIGDHMFTSIGSNYTNDINITIPEGITSIGEYAFSGTHLISIINIPNSVTTIGDDAFSDCQMSTCFIGTGITSIGNSAFYNNSWLSSLTINATTPPSLGDDNFSGEMSWPTIYVPAASVDTYKADNSWSYFEDAIYAIGSNNE